MRTEVFTYTYLNRLADDIKSIESLGRSEIREGLQEIDKIIKWRNSIRLFEKAILYYKKGYCLYLLDRDDETLEALKKSEENIAILRISHTLILGYRDLSYCGKLQTYINELKKRVADKRKIELNNALSPLLRNVSNYVTKIGSVDEADNDIIDKNDIKGSVKKNYQGLISVLDKAVSNISNLDLKSQDLTSIKYKFICELKARKSDLEQKNQEVDNIVWDRLVIAFFGQTNAGKSTIIESLRILLKSNSNIAKHSKSNKNHQTSSRDGEIVGDGRNDFTKDYHEYNLTINGKPFTLIDVPGIEGNEAEYKDGIKQALSKAHCVFYVNGENKDADTGINDKINAYLADYVKVNVLYNVRGDVTNYEFPEDRKCFQTKDVLSVKKQLDSTFRKIIGKNYESVIPVQGFLAMCSYANFSPKRPDLSTKQTKLIQYFSEDCNNNRQKAQEAIKKFSNIPEVFDLINKKSANFKYEIQQSNDIKISRICSDTLRSIKATTEEESKKFSRYEEQLRDFLDNLDSEITNAIKSLSNQLKSSATKRILDLKKELNSSIDSNRTSDGAIRSIFTACSSDIKEKTKRIVLSSNKEIQKRINDMVRDIQGIPGIETISNGKVVLPEITIPYNLGDIDDANSISFGDVVSTVASGGGGALTGAGIGSIIPGIGTAIGALIGGIFGAVAGAASSADDQTQRAKYKASKIVESYKTKVFSQFKYISRDMERQLTEEIAPIQQNVNNTKSQISAYHASVKGTEIGINRILKRINNK
jgi:hypothetical protein